MSINLTHTLNSLWNSLGVNSSDTLLIHSNIKPLLRYFFRNGIRIKTEDILDSILNHVSKGNIIFPAFNFESINNKYFSINETISEMGLLSETARLHKDSKRTKHPVYSFSCFGPITKSLLEVKNYTAYGQDSPFQKLRDVEAKIIVFDLPENRSMTFYHHVEEVLRVDYRYLKEFTFEYIDSNYFSKGLTKFSIFVRDLESKVCTNVEPMGEKLHSLGLYKENIIPKEVKARIVSSKDLFTETEKVINLGNAQGMLYEINEEN